MSMLNVRLRPIITGLRQGRPRTSLWALTLWLLVMAGATSSAVNDSITYTALGDSLAFGLFAPVGSGYVPLYRNHLRDDTGAKVKLYNLSVPGWTSDDLLAALKGNLLFRALVSRSQVVTWDIGGNDLRALRDRYKARLCGGADNQDCFRQGVARIEANWDAIVAEILSLRGGSQTVMRTMDIYNPYLKVDQAADTWAGDGGLNDFQVFKPYLEEVNRHIASTGRGVRFAPVYAAFNGPQGEVDPGDQGLIFFDGLHPNGRGHQVIADLLRALGYAPLGDVSW